MAWVTGKHAEAPQGVLCYVVADAPPGEVTWEEPEGEAAAQAQTAQRRPPQTAQPAQATATAAAEPKRG